MTRTISFLSILFTALALVPYGAHLFALPNKIGMTQDQYFVAQSAYRGWALVGAILFPAMLLNILLAYVLRADRPSFIFAVAACLVMAATLPVFFAWTYPANVATQNWTSVSANWAELRTQWEYSHAVNAVLTLAALCLVTLAALTARGRVPE